jgi:hypothetical protein
LNTKTFLVYGFPVMVMDRGGALKKQPELFLIFKIKIHIPYKVSKGFMT